MSSPPQTPQDKLNLNVTQTMEMEVKKQEKKSKYFFIRRVPFRKVKPDWTRPPAEEYRKQLLEQGFITPELIKGKASPDLEADLRELEQHLLPHFWRVNQEAKYYQNRHYQFQWIFILAAFFTTALAAVNVLIYAYGDGGARILGNGSVKTTALLGFLTALISGVAAMVSFLDANQTPQDRWFKARARAETLRSMYFLFLARQNPFNLTGARDRVSELRKKVIDVLTDTPGMEQRPSTGTTGRFRAAPAEGPASPTSTSESDEG